MKRLFGLAVASLLILAGCQEPQKVGGVPRQNRGATVVSLAPSATDLLGMSLQLERLKGATDACAESLRKNAAVVVHNTKIDYEQIAQIKPGIIIYDSTLYSDLDEAKLGQTGAELLDFKATSLKEYEDSLYRAAHLIGIEVPIGEYVDRMYNVRARFNVEGSSSPVKVMVLMGGSGAYMAAGTKTLQADMIGSVTGTPVGPDSNKFETISPETIVTMNPDLIFCPGGGMQILKDPRLQSVSAVKGKRVFEMNPDHLLRPNGQLDVVMDGIGTSIANFRINSKK